MIAALYVETDGAYFGLPNVEPWDVTRDARQYAGPWPVVAHPPCNRWSMLANVVQARWGYKVGDDGGTFASALQAVRSFGGVLEHPAHTMAWAAHGLLRPTYGVWSRSLFDPGWVAEVYQRNYGHRANKKTWLYCISEYPPELDWSAPEAPEVWISTDRPSEMLTVKNMPKAERRHTPPAFRDLLLSIASTAKVDSL
jgi:hypothetical protein